MPTAYVLLNTKIGLENEALKEIRAVEGVQEAFGLMGIYDIIARIKAETMEKLTQIINEKLQLKRVHSKLTVIIMET
jgi:DNA-binding Lrp family transcriptional regulator